MGAARRSRQTAPLFGPAIPDEVRDEAITVPQGETAYWFLLDDATVEILATGICPEAFAQRCYLALSWKREFYRSEARTK